MSLMPGRGPGLLAQVALILLCLVLPACTEDILLTPPDPLSGGEKADCEQIIHYDLQAFASTIQPLMDAAGCANAGCHGAEARAGNFDLTTAAGSVEIWSNLQAVTSRVDLTATPFAAEDSLFYRKATATHRGSNAIGDPEALRAWLADAAARF